MRHRSAPPERARAWAATETPRAGSFGSATASPRDGVIGSRVGSACWVRTSPRDHPAGRLRRLALATRVRPVLGACSSTQRAKPRVERSKCRLTDDVLLRWIKQNRAVDTSEASASARSTTPPTAATFVRRHSKMHLKGQPVKGRRRPGAAANGVRPEPGTELTRSSERVECTRHRSASPERARVWAVADAPRAHTFESATASPAAASSARD